jgi:hypothetical protein
MLLLHTPACFADFGVRIGAAMYAPVGGAVSPFHCPVPPCFQTIRAARSAKVPHPPISGARRHP